MQELKFGRGAHREDGPDHVMFATRYSSMLTGETTGRALQKAGRIDDKTAFSHQENLISYTSY